VVLSLFIVSFPVGGVLPAGGGAGVSTLPHGVGARGLKQSHARLGLAESAEISDFRHVLENLAFGVRRVGGHRAGGVQSEYFLLHYVRNGTVE
jgi:hypothetical protein